MQSRYLCSHSCLTPCSISSLFLSRPSIPPYFLQRETQIALELGFVGYKGLSDYVTRILVIDLRWRLREQLDVTSFPTLGTYSL